MKELEDNTFQSFNEVAEYVYDIAKDKGFYDKEVNMASVTSNIHGEVSELWDAYRKNQLFKQCDKPVNLMCIEEELADIIIRALETANAYNLNIGEAIKLKSEYNKTRPYRNGGKLA
jgi:NTP pyrophosphatase (non-canonical NTP hydrolase)